MMTLDFLLFFGALILLTKEHLGSPIIRNCDVLIAQWQVRGGCVVENMDTYYGNHVCTWRINNIQLSGYFQNLVTRYVLDGRAYDEGVCYFTHVMPTSADNYTYSISIDSGQWNTVKTLHIVSPGDPKYTCPDVVQEGSNVTCKCTSSSPGSPPAEFVWSGLNTYTLYVPSVKREDSGTRHTCLMTWGPKRFISSQAVLTLKVAVPVSIVRSSCSVQLSKWKVQGVCTIQWLEMNNNSECRWRFTHQSRGYGPSVSTKSVDLGKFQGSSTFVTVDSIRYKRRNCTFEQTMPVLENDYSYSIRVSSHPNDQFSKNIRIEHPGPPTHNCPAIAYEGSSIRCMCNSSKAGIPPAELIWEEVNSDTLQLSNVQRENSGINYTCRLTWCPNRLISLQVVYSLNVIAPVSIVPSSCRLELSGWNVYGVCTIRWSPTKKNRTCNWSLTKKTTKRLIEGVQRVVNSSAVDSFDYVKCYFAQQMPVDDGSYTYSISVSAHPADKFSKTFHIARPATPQHNCSNVTLEGSSINCTCFSLNLGDPPAKIGWVETNEEHFAIKDIKREQKGIVATCRLTWGTINYTTPYIVQVAYGPSETYIGREESSDDKSKTVLICTAIDVYPSAVFRWSISCDKETHSVNISTCTVSTTRIQDNMVVECMAHNNIFTDVSSNSTYVFKPEKNSLHGGIIAGSTTAVVIATIIVAVIFLYIKRRKDVNKNKTQTPTAHFYAPSGQLYTIAGNVTTVDYRQHEYSTVRDTSLDNNSRTQTPVVRFTAASGDLSTIAGPAPVGNQKQLTLQEATRNRVYESTSNSCKNKLLDLSVAVEGYVNVTEVPTDSRPGVYHNLSWAAIPQTVRSDARVLDQSVNSEDDYNVLRFQEDRTGEEDHAVTYSHLHFN